MSFTTALRIRSITKVAVVAIVAAVGPLALASPAGANPAAGATRTWVSGVGDDANPCSRTAPCKTFAGAISKTADSGEINALDPGGFGTVNIIYPVTIDGAGFTAGVLAAGTNGVVINAPGKMVELRGLDINGVGTGLNGIRILAAKAVRIEDTTIYNFVQQGIDIEPGAATSVTLDNVFIHDNVQDGIFAAPPTGAATNVQITNSRIVGNGCGVVAAAVKSTAAFSTATCAGDGTATTGTVEIDSANSAIQQNTGAGVLANGAAAKQQLTNDTISGNGTGLSPLNGGTIVTVGANSVVGNGTNGAPSSTVSSGNAGPAGATGATGATGPAGPAGAAGKVELVTCKTVNVKVTKKVKGKLTKVTVAKQSCTTKVITGVVKFTTTGKPVTAKLAQAGHVVATGSGVLTSDGRLVRLTIGRRLSAGRYQLSLSANHRVIRRTTISLG